MSTGSVPGHADEFVLAGADGFADELPDELRARVKRELKPGERLLWAARSYPPIELRGPGFYFACIGTHVFLGVGILCLASGVNRIPKADSILTPGLVSLGANCPKQPDHGRVWPDRIERAVQIRLEVWPGRPGSSREKSR
jgi:hypothetical protein